MVSITPPQAGSAISSGLIAARPAAGSVPNGSTYLATDVDAGTLYVHVAGAWVQAGAGVNGGGGGRELKKVLIPQFTSATGNAVQEITGATFDTAVPQSSLPVDIELFLPQIRVASWGTSTRVLCTLSIYTTADVLLAFAAGVLNRYVPPGTAAATDALSMPVAQSLIPFPSLPKHRLAASAASSNYKLTMTLLGYDAAGASKGASSDVTVLIAQSAFQEASMRAVTVAT